jgi:hypothetical protein
VIAQHPPAKLSTHALDTLVALGPKRFLVEGLHEGEE